VNATPPPSPVAALPDSVRFRWSAPRARPRRTGTDWSDWWRWFDHATGLSGRRLRADASTAEALVGQWVGAADAELDERIAEIRLRMRRQRHLQAGWRALRCQALAVAAVLARRTLGKDPYTVQLHAALAMREGLLVQMAAGEGKTLAVALAGVLHGWEGMSCHIVTANDYLAGRDAQLMSDLYGRCGVRVAAVGHGMTPEALRQAYDADVVYGTSKQFLADHLLDQIVLEGAFDPGRRRIRELRPPRGAVRTRGLHSALIDEADSVLIDEANTPLIISAPQPNPLLVSAVLAARDVADQLKAIRDYRIDLEFREVEFTEQGRDRLEDLARGLPPVWHAPERRDDLVRQAIAAREVYLRDRHYIVQDGKIEILDENTGRVLPGRSWSYGLHQAIEAREGVPITHPSRTMARMSFQEFFRHFHHLGGASGTLQGVRSELWWTYGLLTLVLPFRLPSQLKVPAPRHFADSSAKWQALVDDIERLHAEGHPVLVGTRRLSDSELLQQRLRLRGLDCALLNAKQHDQEALVIAQAGRPGQITVATNMAGRGTDILIDPEVAARGGLQVLMLEPHESVRVDWQLFGRAGRQGQPGRAQAYAALDDDLLLRHLPVWLAPLRRVLRLTAAGRGWWIGPFIWLAQRRVQSRAFQQRRYLQQRERELRKQLAFTGAGHG
jgi:preprotein translocase subunit SecA